MTLLYKFCSIYDYAARTIQLFNISMLYKILLKKLLTISNIKFCVFEFKYQSGEENV